MDGLTSQYLGAVQNIQDDEKWWESPGLQYITNNPWWCFYQFRTRGWNRRRQRFYRILTMTQMQYYVRFLQVQKDLNYINNVSKVVWFIGMLLSMWPEKEFQNFFEIFSHLALSQVRRFFFGQSWSVHWRTLAMSSHISTRAGLPMLRPLMVRVTCRQQETVLKISIGISPCFRHDRFKAEGREIRVMSCAMRTFCFFRIDLLRPFIG